MPNISEIPHADELSPERRARVELSIKDAAYFRGRVSAILELGEKRHEECRKQREENESNLFSRVGSLEKKWSKLVGYILGATAVITVTLYILERVWR